MKHFGVRVIFAVAVGLCTYCTFRFLTALVAQKPIDANDSSGSANVDLCSSCSSCALSVSGEGQIPQLNSSKCFNAVIDLGSNDGMMIRDFIGANDSSEMGRFFIDKNWNAKDFCIFAFEGNPAFTARLLEQQKQWREQGYDVRIFPETVVGGNESPVNLYLDPDVKHKYWGTTIVDSRKKRRDYKESVRVKSVMLSKFVKDNVDPAGTLFVKMDIEGAEYRVLHDLLSSGLLCSKCPHTGSLLFDYMNIEPHCHRMHEVVEVPSIPLCPGDRCSGWKVYMYYMNSCGISYSAITD